MVVTPIPAIRRRAQHRLVLRVEFENASGFRASFLADLPDGGLRIGTSVEVGQHLLVDVVFASGGDHLQIDAVVAWTLPAGHPEGPASGLQFVEPSPEALAWLSDVLDSSTQVFVIPERADRVVLLEVQPFLRDVYGQEVRNWAELRDEQPLELLAVDDVEVWIDEVTRGEPMLAIVDIDGMPPGVTGYELYQRVRARDSSVNLPLIVIGSPASLAPFDEYSDDLLFCLRKPLRFGLLMNTVRVLATDRARS